MKLIDEFRDGDKARALAFQIEKLTKKLSGRSTRPLPLHLMEFCGGHTHTIFKYGIEQLLPPEIEMIHGPGCPVCVLPTASIDSCIRLAERDGVIITTFGDAMRVPGSKKSLIQARAEGADVRMVYSPLDTLSLAAKHPDKDVIFFAIGFETTMPSTAITVLQAEMDDVANFSLFCNHITTLPTVKAVLDAPDVRLDGLLAPGHVSMVIGQEPFARIAETYDKPVVITGFEPLDILQSIYMLLVQITDGKSIVENQYSRVVSPRGNKVGLEAMSRVFETRESSEWRGLGAIEQSGVKMTEEFAQYDAERKYDIVRVSVEDPEVCQCGDVLKGVIKPWQCKIFGTTCTPRNPMGALMVSSEGACAAYYNFGDKKELLAKRETATGSTN